MMAEAPEIEGATIVLAGSLNPGIFHPQWFARYGLIRDAEADSAENVISTPDFTRFETDWMTVEALSERITFLSTSALFYDALRDLAKSVIQLLPHTPLQAIGLNRSAHFQLGNREIYDQLGHSLAPKELWSEILDRPGMRRLSIQGERSDGYSGMVLVSVEPSIQVTHGLFIDVNDHFQRASDLEVADEEWVEGILSTGWEAHSQRVPKIQQSILDKALKG